MAGPLTVGLKAAGSLISAGGTIASGIAQNKAAKFEAKQMERQGKAEMARGSRVAAEEARQKRIALSRAQALGAASGAGRASRLEGELEREGAYRSLTAVWEGEERAAGRFAQAKARRFEGKQAKAAGFVRGLGTLASGLGEMSLLRKYGSPYAPSTSPMPRPRPLVY